MWIYVPDPDEMMERGDLRLPKCLVPNNPGRWLDPLASKTDTINGVVRLCAKGCEATYRVRTA